MAYKRKTKDVYNIMCNYGNGLEVDCSYYTYKDARQGLREYRESVNGYHYSLKKTREVIQ